MEDITIFPLPPSPHLMKQKESLHLMMVKEPANDEERQAKCHAFYIRLICYRSLTYIITPQKSNCHQNHVVDRVLSARCFTSVCQIVVVHI